MLSRTSFTLGISWAAVALSSSALAVSAGNGLTSVPNANPKSAGTAVPNVLSRELIESVVAQGSSALENGTSAFPFYGYDGDGAELPAPSAIQSPGFNVEATKTEPDKNTYLVVQGQHGPDANYDYGSHFLYQGHELGAKNASTGQQAGYITRINLDADGAHRVTLLASQDAFGNPLPVIDGSTWNPFAQRLLFTSEGGPITGGVWQATLDFPSTVVDLSGIVGRAGYEGIQTDSRGNLLIVEDVGGAKGAVNKHAKQPNSFLYRFVPKNKSDLTLGGKLQALQVMSLANAGQPIVFHAGQADFDILSQDVADLHTYGLTFATHWVKVHDTDVDGFAPFDANALAKLAQATPFKRPENGQFRPGSKFNEFYFDETGDTDATTEAGSLFGGFGSVLKWTRTSDSDGTLALVFRGDLDHTGFDNDAFWDADHMVFVEDRGDTLHSQHNAFDSAFLIDVDADYADPSTPAPTRILALGRDASATIDSGLSGVGGNGFQNEGDNEITGFHVSDGDAKASGLLGAKVPTPFKSGWRVFYTQQHGDNATREILPSGL